MLKKLIKAVRRAGKIMSAGCTKINQKDGVTNVVTDKDLAVETFLRRETAKLFSSVGFIGEEKDFTKDALEKEYTVIIDPIDGTMNFTRNMGLSIISLAVLKNGSPMYAVLFNPYTDELFSAEKGKGAYLNGKRIFVSDKKKEEGILFTAWSIYRKEFARQCFAISESVYSEINDIRRLGACALELCYLAAGRGDLFFEIRAYPWDLAAGAFLIEEAGGFVGTLNGEKLTYDKPQPLLAANSQENFEYLKEKLTAVLPTVPYQ